MDKEFKLKKIARILLFAASVIWGTTFFIMKNTLDTMGSSFIMAVRFSTGTVLLTLIFLPRLKKFNIGYFMGGGITGVLTGIASVIQTIGLSYTTPGKNAFLTAVYCVFVPFLYWITAKKRPTIYNIASALICIAGIGFVTLNKDLTFNIGDLLTLFSGCFFAFQILCINKFGANKDIFLFNIAQFLFTSIVCWISFAIFEDFPTNVPLSSWLSLLYLAVFGTTVAFTFMTFGVKHLSPSSSSLIISLESVFGVLFSIVFYNEKVTVSVVIGFVLILIAVIVSETELKFLKLKPIKKDNN